MKNAGCRMKNSPKNHRLAACRPSAFSIRHSPFARGLLAGLAFACAAVAARAQPLLLDDAIRLALEKNPQIKVQAYGRSIARADLLTALGKFDPTLNFTRSYREDASLAASNVIVANLIKTDDYSLGLQGTTPWGLSYNLKGTAENQRYPQTGYTDNFLTFGGVEIRQPLLRNFGFGANLVGVRIAKADRGIADWQFRQTAIDTVTAVINAYSDLAYAQQALRIAQRSRELAAGLLDENEKRFKVGSVSESEVTQARARTASRDDAILSTEQGVRDAVNRLRALMGETEFPLNPATPLIDIAEVPDAPIDPAADLKRAYDTRPDYQAAKLGLLKRRANDAYARNQMLPQVDFVGGYGYSGLSEDFSTSRRQVRNHDNRSYSAGVVVSIPLTFAEERGRARSARLQLRQGEADLQRLEQDIAVAIAAAAGQIETTRKRVAANRAAYDLAKQALDAEIKKLRAGTSSTYVVLGLQQELIGAEYDLHSALSDQRRALAAYDRQLGRTLEVRHIALDKP